MRHALERIDVSENMARRKRFEFVTLAGVACELIGFGAFAGAAFVQSGYYKGILLILLLPASGDDALSVRGRFSMARGGSSYPGAGFTRVIRERLNDAGRVVTVSDSDYFVTTQFVRAHPLELMKGVSGSERTLRPVGSDRDEPTGEVSRQKVKELMRRARLVVMIIGKIGKIAEPGGKFSASTEHILSTKGILVFPPVSYRETQARWESFCQQIYGAAPPRLVSDHELKRAVLFVFRKRAGPLLITADTRNEWTYQAALDEAMAAVRRDESGTESGFAGLEGEGSTRSR